MEGWSVLVLHTSRAAFGLHAESGCAVRRDYLQRIVLRIILRIIRHCTMNADEKLFNFA